MIQAARIISVYAADTSGVCSMLYELGGMCVIHDASGCNSTYSTHDEPRWYDMDSMVYISALTEVDAIMGNDRKFVNDVVTAARELSPKFIAVCGSPMPMMTGTDFEALAAEIEGCVHIPTIPVSTNGMHPYIDGARRALVGLLSRFCDKNVRKSDRPSVNIIGATPLDFSINGSVDSIKTWCESNGFDVVSCMAMGSSLEEISQAGRATVNLVVSQSGLDAAKWLNEQFGTPFAVGVPIGAEFSKLLADELRSCSESGKCTYPCAEAKATRREKNRTVAVVGESVYSGSLARAIETEYNVPVSVLCPFETEKELTNEYDEFIPNEFDAEEQFKLFGAVVADPMYEPVCNAKFYSLPHIAFSGRCYQRFIPNIINKRLERLR